MKKKTSKNKELLPGDPGYQAAEPPEGWELPDMSALLRSRPSDGPRLQTDRGHQALTKSDIAKLLSKDFGVARTLSAVMIEHVLSSIENALANGLEVKLRGFGAFSVSKSQGGKDQGQTAQFRPGKHLTEAVNHKQTA